MVGRVAGLAAILVAIGGGAWAQSSVPRVDLTPGALNPAVTQATIDETICVRGWTASIRPPREFTEALKRRQIREYGYRDRRLRHYEEDHLVPLDLGGAPADPRNLWPEPRHPRDGWSAHRKDELEWRLVRLVCRRQMSLSDARDAFTHDWRLAWTRYVGDR